MILSTMPHRPLITRRVLPQVRNGSCAAELGIQISDGSGLPRGSVWILSVERKTADPTLTQVFGLSDFLNNA